MISISRKLATSRSEKVIWEGKGGLWKTHDMHCSWMYNINSMIKKQKKMERNECKHPITCYVAMQFLMASKSSDRFYLIHKWDKKVLSKSLRNSKCPLEILLQCSEQDR